MWKSLLGARTASCALALWLALGCEVSDRLKQPDGDAANAGSDDAGRDATMPDAGELSDASEALDAAEPVDASIPDARGVSFEPLAVRTKDGQTIALSGATGLAFLPGDHGLLVWEKTARVGHYKLQGNALVQQGEMQLPGVYTESDCGLVGLAVDPDWENNHYLFVTHCISPTHGAVERYAFDGASYDTVPGTASLVLEVGDPKAPKPYHNLSALGFFDDAEHSLWVLSGEKKVPANAQDLTNDLGAVLRIVPKRGAGTSGYDPHPDNPFAMPGGGPSSGQDLYAWGLRSPWRGALDKHGRLWIGDVGNQQEEVNLAFGAGQNFGWPLVEGKCSSDLQDCDELSDPLIAYSRDSSHAYRVADPEADPTTGRVVTIAMPYDASKNDRYAGLLTDSVLFGDACLGFVRALAIDADHEVVRDDHLGHLIGVSGAVQGDDGYLYVSSFGSSCSSAKNGIGSAVYRVRLRKGPQVVEPEPVPSGKSLVEAPLSALPLRISQTGFFTDDALDALHARARRFAPTLPLWSNGSDKERFVLLPEGAKIDNTDRTRWDFPPGTLFVKTFSYRDAADVRHRIETRIIRRTASAYDYHVYQWRADGSDADLLSLVTSVPVPVTAKDGIAFTHSIPNRFDCKSCHESNRTVVIGFDELRLDGPSAAGSGSQLEAFAAAGLFAEVLPVSPDAVSGADATTRQVLGYLHGNCAHCHNATPNSMSPLSLEHGVALANIVNVPTQGSGQASGIRVQPGSPSTSVLFEAFSGETDDHEIQAMPPIGVQRSDAAMIEVLRSWIIALPQ